MDRPPARQGLVDAWSSKESTKDDPFIVRDPRQEQPVTHREHAVSPTTTVQEPTSPTAAQDLKKTSSGLHQTRARLGLHPSAPVVDEHDEAEHSDLWWAKVRLTLKEPFAEFFGVFIMVLFGDGSVAQVLLSKGETSAPGGMGYGQYQSISWGWGIGVMLGIYVAGDSGAYLKYVPSWPLLPTCTSLTETIVPSPAITLTNCLLRKLPWRRFPIYLLAQFLGGFVAAGVIYANYVNGINTIEGSDPVTGKPLRTVPPSKTATAGIFCTYPQQDLTKASQVSDITSQFNKTS